MTTYYSQYGMREYDTSLLAREADPCISWKVTVAPTVEPVTLNQFKEFARIDGNFEDDSLNAILVAARQLTESYLNRALIEQTIELVMNYWPSIEIELPRPPLISISSVVTLDESNVATTYSSDNYYINTNAEPGILVLKRSVTAPINTDRENSGYKITYKAGYGSTAVFVPQGIKEGIKFWATAIYEGRMPSNEPPPIAAKVLDQYRIYYL